jgi:hypothetical protein
MNKQRRKELGQLWDRLNVLKAEWEAWQERVTEVKEQLDDLMNIEQDAFDAMPMSLQEGERGMDMQEGISALENVVDGLDGIAGEDVAFDEWLENIDNARGAE